MPAASSRAIVSRRMSSCQNGSGRVERVAGASSCSSRSACSSSIEEETALPRSSSSVTRRPYPGGEASALATLLDLGGLPTEVAQVVQLGATDVAAGHDLD